MIGKQPPRYGLTDLRQPLRDVMQGLSTLANAGEDLLEPAAQLLPAPLRESLKQAAQMVEAAGKRLIDTSVEMGQIHHAAHFLAGTATSENAASDCAAVIVYAWGHLPSDADQPALMVSETLLSGELARMRAASGATGVAFATDVLMALHDSNAIGLAPGITRGPKEPFGRGREIRLLTIAVWLLTSRAASLEEEEQLLNLSRILVSEFQDGRPSAFADQASLLAFLTTTPDHL